MNHFTVKNTGLNGLHVVKREQLLDDRGSFERLFCMHEFKQFTKSNIVQINRTITKNIGTVRGLHYQTPPFSEVKIVSCLRGEVFDVAVDLRPDSPTFLKHHSERLSESNNQTFVIPEGFAHGFQTLTDNCEMIYFHTACYNASSEIGLNAMDPLISIPWPLPVSHRSSKDKSWKFLTSDSSKKDFNN